MYCRICDGTELVPLEVESFLFPNSSYSPEFHVYKNYLCCGCGVVSGQPEPEENRLIEHYNSEYRLSSDSIEIDGRVIDTPINMSISGRTLQRVKNFYAMLKANLKQYPQLQLDRNDVVVDFGAYQGLFLYGLSQLLDCRFVAADYNENGIEFARKVFGFTDSQVTKDIYTDTFGEKVSCATMIHSLEHLREPTKFLIHLRENILRPDGFMYVEVPNLYGTPLCEPTHFFTYSEKSLTYLMNRSGYEVLDIKTSGFPRTPEFTGHNDIQNVICLARPCREQTPLLLPEVNPEEIITNLRKHYYKHSVNSVKRQFKKALTEAAKFTYYFIFSIILEKISPKLMIRIASMLGRRKSNTGTTG